MENKKIVNEIKNKPVETITLGFIEDAIKLTHSTLIREKIAYNFIKKGWVDLETNQYSKALKSFNRALKIFTKKDDLDGYLLSYHGIASIYNSCKWYNKALEIYFDILQKLDNRKSDLTFITLKDISHTYYLWGSYDDSLKYLRIAMNLLNSDSSIYRKIYIHYNIGKAYQKLGKLDESQESLFMTLTLCDANNINYKISEALTSLGNIFRKKQNFVRSESFHIRALQYAKSNRDYATHIEVLLNLGSLMYYSGDYKKSIQFMFSAIEEIPHIENRYKKLIKAYHYLFMACKDLGDTVEALKYLQKSMVLKEEEIVKVSKVQYKLLHLELRFNIESKTHNKRDRLEHFDIIKDNNDLLELTTAIYKGLKDILKFSTLSLYSFKDESNTLIQTTVSEGENGILKEIDGNGTLPYLSMIEDREIIIYDRDRSNLESKINLNKLTKGMRSFIFLPLKRGDLIVGAVSIEDEESNKYTQFDLNTLKIVSSYTSLLIENMRIKDEVDSFNSLMEHDTIIIESSELDSSKPQRDRESGLPQKSLFLELLEQALKGTKRDKGKIALLTIIVDFEFEKKGTFLSEDIIIGEHDITQRIKDSLRSEDILGKESDDTYLLAIKMESIRGCRTVAKKLVSEIRKPIFTENQKVETKVKIGITIYPDNCLDSNELLDKSKKCALRIPKDNLGGYEFSESIHNITSID